MKKFYHFYNYTYSKEIVPEDFHYDYKIWENVLSNLLQQLCELLCKVLCNKV